MESIHHFRHRHSLVLVDQEPGDQGSRKGFCSGCNQAVLEGYCYECRKAAEGYCSGCDEELEGSSYGCGECGFFLHKKCAELQRVIINHPLHSEHPLTLHLEDYAHNSCNVCRKVLRFFYRCKSCDFDLDLRCAMHPQFVAQEFQKLQHFSHDHPLILVEDTEFQTKHKVCPGCREPMYKSSPFYCCPKCIFHLHKKCAELQREIINHPLHFEHPLTLRLEDYAHNSCNVCGIFTGSFYGCDSCAFDLDLRCAMHPQFVAQEFQKLQHFSHHHPLILVEDIEIQIKEQVCPGCRENMYKSSPFYCCPNCRFYLHKKCAELPLKINHPNHRKHPLMLLAKPPPHQEKCSCNLCSNSWKEGFVYYCSICELGLKAAHPISQTIIAETHDHPLTFFLGIISFVCDACGMDGSRVCFTCAECSLIIHTDCTSLRRTIKIIRHPHRLSHIYFFQDTEEAGNGECNICHDDINLGYGSYCCSDCKYFAHVNCAIDKDLLEDEESESSDDWTAIFPAFQEIKPGEIKHFSHKHNLILSDDGVEDGQSCEGCMRSISTSFYYCAQCNFFLCKCCVHEFPKKVRHWTCRHLRELLFYSIFYCDYCEFWSAGFGYDCNACEEIMCVRCHEILDTRIVNVEGQEHSFFFDHKYEEKCNGCDDYCGQRGFRCKDKKCNFTLDYRCLVLPETARYKYDYHALKLTHRDDHDLSQCYCDICEENRDPKQWFYHCADCDVSAHPNCVLWKSPFVKLGKPFPIDDHEHPVTLVKIDFYPPKCNKCGKPCRDDLSIQCTEPDCTYIFHWECYWKDGYDWKWYLLHTD
ncbi:hypothetical protein SLE2022_278100 [Rubroshorea leprosula]